MRDSLIFVNDDDYNNNYQLIKNTNEKNKLKERFIRI